MILAVLGISLAAFGLVACDNGGSSGGEHASAGLGGQAEPTESEGRLENALQSGDPAMLEASDSRLILEELLSRLQANKEEKETPLEDIYGNRPIQYTLGTNSSFIQAVNIETYIPLLVGNKGNALAAAAVDEGHRSAAFGSLPILDFYRGDNLDYEPHFKRLITWLLERNPDEATTVAVAFLEAGTQRVVKAWLEEHYDWTVNLCTYDPENRESIISNADLVILGSYDRSDLYDPDAIVPALANAKNKGVPLLYLHNRGQGVTGSTKSVLSLLGFSIGSSGGIDDSADWTRHTDMPAGSFVPLETLLTHLSLEDFEFDWSQCTRHSCSEVDGLQSELMLGLECTRDMLKSMDQQALSLFQESGNVFNKLLVLLGDLYRRGIEYPINRLDIDDRGYFKPAVSGTVLAKALFADYSVYYNRKINPAQPDLGNFGFFYNDGGDEKPIPIPADHPTVDRNLTITPLNIKADFTAVGLYALPGRTVTDQVQKLL
jgi:hypothetical protein